MYKRNHHSYERRFLFSQGFWEAAPVEHKYNVADIAVKSIPTAGEGNRTPGSRLTGAAPFPERRLSGSVAYSTSNFPKVLFKKRKIALADDFSPKLEGSSFEKQSLTTTKV